MMNDRPSPKDETAGAGPETDLSRRLERLENALDARRPAPSKTGRGRNEEAQGFAQALRLSSEFVAGVLVGAALGWALDKGLGTSPWGLIVFLLLGFAAGVFNVLRAAGLMAEAGPRKVDGTKTDTGPKGSDNEATKG